MKQLRYIFLFIILFCSNNSLFAQSYKLRDLCATKWNVESGLDGLEFLYVNWDVEMTRLTITLGAKDGSEEEVICLLDMYLSDKKQDSFDKSKIGKYQSGKYIVTYNTYELLGINYENFNCYEIVTLTPYKLVVKENDNCIVFSSGQSKE